MTNDSGRQAGVHQIGEIEITDEMIEAGITALLGYADDYAGFSQQWKRVAVSAVYASMAGLSPQLSRCANPAIIYLSEQGR